MPNHSHTILRLKETLKITGLSRSKLYELQGAGEFPHSIKLSRNGSAVGWIESEVHSWIQARIAERDCAA